MDKNLALETLKTFVKNTVNVIAKDAILTLHPELAESEDERIRKRLIDCLKFSLKGAEEQDAAGCSRQKDIEAYKWGISYLEKQKEQKPAEWSEEDEKNWNEYIERLKSEYERTPNVVLWDDINWLEYLHEKFKSLRPQPHWKPSEEQMLTLCRACRKVAKQDAECLDSLYNDLKELM